MIRRISVADDAAGRWMNTEECHDQPSAEQAESGPEHESDTEICERRSPSTRVSVLS